MRQWIKKWNRRKAGGRERSWFRSLPLVLVMMLSAALLFGCTPEEEALLEEGLAIASAFLEEDPGSGQGWEENSGARTEAIDEDGSYTSKEDVALYIHTYGKLPENFITKKEANRLGWQGGKLEPYAPGKSIGGDHFGNYEGTLPEKKGRTYTECDIDTKGKKRGAKRMVFSNDGLIYYSDDHYETFTLLYGEE